MVAGYVTGMTVAVIIVAIVLAVAVCAWFFVGRSSEEAAEHGRTEQRSASQMTFGDVNDRPGGPGAEADGVVGPGQIAPGPTPELGERGR